MFKSPFPPYDPREVEAPEGSINAELLALPQMRDSTYGMTGRVLYFPRTDIIGVPTQIQGSHSWKVVIVDGGAKCLNKHGGRQTYPRGGYDIIVSDLEMQTAIEIEVSRP